MLERTRADLVQGYLEDILIKFRAIVPVALLLLATTVGLHAQITGCDDSPENPTLVLGLIVGAASFGYGQIRRYAQARKRPKDR
jgi:XrtJ-associated TM-motif-TM protein